MTNLQRYQKVFVNIFQMEEDTFNEKFTFASVEQWDSITHMSLITELEDEFDIMFDTEDILNYQSYENGKKLLRKYDVEV